MLIPSASGTTHNFASCATKAKHCGENRSRFFPATEDDSRRRDQPQRWSSNRSSPSSWTRSSGSTYRIWITSSLNWAYGEVTCSPTLIYMRLSSSLSPGGLCFYLWADRICSVIVAILTIIIRAILPQVQFHNNIASINYFYSKRMSYTYTQNIVKQLLFW